MITFLDIRSRKDSPELEKLMGDLYIPSFHCNPLSLLKKGMWIWKDNHDDSFSVFELQEAYDKFSGETREDFINRLSEAIDSYH